MFPLLTMTVFTRVKDYFVKTLQQAVVSSINLFAALIVQTPEEHVLLAFVMQINAQLVILFKKFQTDNTTMLATLTDANWGKQIAI